MDSLRGWALLGMALSGLLPWGSLPAWMYHAQLPPPEMRLNQEVYGITWVDLVFPFFLFALGAAIPLAAQNRGSAEQPLWRQLGAILQRFLLLAAFGILVQNTRPAQLGDLGTPTSWWLGLAFMAAIVLSMVRTPSRRKHLDLGLRIAGWIGVFAAWLFLYQREMFSLMRQDIIIMVLAGVSLTGGLLAILERRDSRVLWLGLGLTFAWVVAAYHPGPARDFWQWNPIPQLTQPQFQKYLLLVIPGMIAGAWLLRRPAGAMDRRELGIALAGLLAIPICLVLLMTRQVLLCLALCSLLGVGCVAWGNRTRLHEMLWLGWGLLVTGLLVEPMAGGIRKDSATPSYYLVTAGLAILFLLALMALNQITRREDRAGWVAKVGANPLLGYILITHFIFSLVRVTGFHGWAGGQGWSPWGFAVYAGFQTLIIAGVAAYLTSRKIFMRA